MLGLLSVGRVECRGGLWGMGLGGRGRRGGRRKGERGLKDDDSTAAWATIAVDLKTWICRGLVLEFLIRLVSTSALLGRDEY